MSGELGRRLLEAAAAIGDRKMPEVGGRRLAGEFSSMMADVRKSIEESKQIVAAAVKELQQEVTEGAQDAAKALRNEAAEVRKGYAELLGNNPSDGTATE